jgi:hypothetical protein
MRVVSVVVTISLICGIADTMMVPRHAWTITFGRGLVGAMVGCTIAVTIFAIGRALARRTNQRATTGVRASL